MSYKWNTTKTYRKITLPKLYLQEKTKEENLVVPDRVNSGILLLPNEILNTIAQFLSVHDIISCSATCTRLRAVFNDNFIWKKFCKQNIIKYFQNFKQNIDADYDIDSLKYDLDPMCEERINYIQQNQLLNNWKNGKFIEHKIHSSSGLYYMSLKSGTNIIYNDIYLFLYDFYAHTIVIWNIEDTPVPYTNIRLLYHNYYYEGLHFEIVKNKLVVFEVGKLIQIYGINLPEKILPLISLILVENDSPLGRIPEFNNPEEMYAVCYHRIIQNKIYSHKVGKPILHIWDVERGKKITSLRPPKKGSDISVLSAANNGNDLILCLEINDQERQFNALGTVYEVFSYSFSRDFFKTFWTNKEPSSSCYIPFHAVQYQDLVVLFCRLNKYFLEDSSLPKSILVFYDYKWGVIIGEKSFPELVCHKQIKVTNGKLLLATAFCLYILDINIQDIVYSFKIDCSKLELLNVFDGNFIITTPKALVSVSKTKRKDVWDVKNRRKCVNITYMFTSPYSRDSVFVNESFTKMVVVGKGTLGILNFW